MTTDQPSLILITTTLPNQQSAIELAQKLVAERLVACGQVLPAMTSIYVWQGEMCQETEHLLLLKTTADNFTPVATYLKQHHPYTEPQITAIPITHSSQGYRQWVTDSTKPQP
jgi:periplasmic divalent cation tolerance protein